MAAGFLCADIILHESYHIPLRALRMLHDSLGCMGDYAILASIQFFRLDHGYLLVGGMYVGQFRSSHDNGGCDDTRRSGRPYRC